MTHDVFISFSFKDRSTAEKIYQTLISEYGISCWICTRDIIGGESFKALIPNAIDASRIVVVIQSRSAVESAEIPKEVGIAFDAGKKIIPFRLDDAEPKDELRYDLYGVEYIDARIPTREERIRDLAESIRRLLDRPLPSEPLRDAGAAVLQPADIPCSEIFAGREELMEELDRAFAERRTVFLRGMGGIGKSELAMQYRKRRRDYYRTAVFARYTGNLASLIADDEVFRVRGLARRTNERDVPQTDEEYARDKLAAIRRSTDEHTLIILDNFDVAVRDDPFFEELVSGGTYRVLVTTRCEQDRKKYYTVPVEEMNDDALKEIFLAYANPHKTMIDAEDPGFPELFRLTARHTYTLELIARFMEQSDEIDTLDEMLPFLKEHGFRELEVDGYDSICRLFRFASLGSAEREFLRCLVLMPPAGVSQILFKKWLGGAFSARSRLADLGLVKINGAERTVSLHPLVREAAADELHPAYESCREFIGRCVMLGEDANQQMWSLPYAEKIQRLECFRSILAYMPEVNDETYPVYKNMSLLFNFVGGCGEAVALLEKLLAYMSARPEKYASEEMLIHNRIAWKYANTNLSEQAISHYRTAADWFWEHPVYSDRESHDPIRSCADLYIAMYRESHDPSDRENAYLYLQRAREYGERMLAAAGEESEYIRANMRYQIDTLCRQYGKLYIEEGEYALADEALNGYREAIRRFEEEKSRITGSPREPSADRGSCSQLMGQLRYAQGRFAEAREALEEARSLYTHYFSLRNPRTILTVEQLVRCCLRQGDRACAEEYLREAAEAAKVLFTDEHPVRLRLQALEAELAAGASAGADA